MHKSNNLCGCQNNKLCLLFDSQRSYNLSQIIVNDVSNHFCSTPFIVYLNHIDIVAPIIQQRVGVDIWFSWLERDYLFINQILNFVLEVDKIFGIMPNTVGMISTSLIVSVEF